MKRDLNYIAALEKAIGQQYGDIATINPKSLWNQEKEQEYIEQIKESYRKEAQAEKSQQNIDLGGVLISKKLLIKNIERSCSYCKKYSFNRDDDLYLTKYNCCYICYIAKVEGRQ
jgi:hypothetical protein